jgi:hypothetical protein
MVVPVRQEDGLAQTNAASEDVEIVECGALTQALRRGSCPGTCAVVMEMLFGSAISTNEGVLVCSALR